MQTSPANDGRVNYRAVIFDIGGVIVGSPLHAIAAFERECGIPSGFVNQVVAGTGEAGAWSRLERGLLTVERFVPEFEADCRAAGLEIAVGEMMRRIGEITQPRPQMLGALTRLRAGGLRVAALTNNWTSEERRENSFHQFFDVFVESVTSGLQKPDPRIYQLVCTRLDIIPAQAIFLDDIGRNLKAARELGMATIKVDDPDAALRELSAMVGFELD